MSRELESYINNRISEMQQTLNNNLNTLSKNLKNNIQIIQKSKRNPAVKTKMINSLIAIYNKNVNELKQKNKEAIESIKKYVPKPVIINRNKKALLIGINYVGTQSELRGCVNDVNSIKDRLILNGFSNISTMTDFTDKKPTKANILQEFKKLLSEAESGDLLVFGYSGHGSYTLDRNKDENTSYDQLIVPIDFNTILDDDLKTIIHDNLKQGVTLFAIFDSCFSGSVLDLRYQYFDSLNYDKYTENKRVTETKGNVFMISGCSDKQTSADAFINNRACGAMTWSLLEASKLKPYRTWRELVKIMRDLLRKSDFDQIPQFSSGTFENIDSPAFI